MILNNGRLCSGSALQNTIGFSTCVKLPAPNGKNVIEGNNGVLVSEPVLISLSKSPELWTDSDQSNFVWIVNQLYKQDGDENILSFKQSTLDNEDFAEFKENLIDLIQTHNLTDPEIAESEEAIKTKVFYKVFSITQKAQNLRKADITVDECTGKLKKLAKNTSGGNAEKHVSPDVPTSKFVMQDQAQLGKADVGIGAVSLKSYFMLCTQYNSIVEEMCKVFDSTDLDELTKEQMLNDLFKRLTIRRPDGTRTTLAGTNLDPILERMPDNQALLQLHNNSKNFDVAEKISGIISLSADNMKDLTLPKLNATEDLVDIYTTAFMMGIGEDEIVKMMTSPIFTWIVKIGRPNIFDTSSNFIKVKDLIKILNFSLDDYEHIKNDLTYGILEYGKYSKNKEFFDEKTGAPLFPERTLLTNSRFLDKIIKAFEGKNGILNKYSLKPVKIDPEDHGDVEDQDFKFIGKKDVYRIYKLLKAFRDRLSFDKEQLDQLSNLEYLMNCSEEMSVVGRQGGINQGLKSNIPDFYNFVKNVESFYNKRIEKYNKGVEDYKKLEYIDFDKILSGDAQYTNLVIQMIDTTPGLKYAFNAVDAIVSSPHFFAMSSLAPLGDKILFNVSHTYRKAMKAFNDLSLEINRGLNRNEYKQLLYYLNDISIYNFFAKGDVILNIGEIARLCERYPEVYASNAHTSIQDLDNLPINDMQSIRTFKYIFEDYIIPKLQSAEEYKNNDFIQSLQRIPNRTINGNSFALPIELARSDSDQTSSELYTKYLSGFNDLCKDSFAGHNIGDLFFLYNLIVNKNGFGRSSLTKIFEDLVNSKNRPKIISSYYKYISDLDSSEDQEIDLKEAKYRIAANVIGTKVKSDKTKQTLLENQTFDLPFTGGSFTNAIKTKPTMFIPVGKMSPSDIITTFVNRLNSKQSGIARVISNSDLADNNYPNEKAFIRDGIIYLNVDKFNDYRDALSVATHELAHLIFAGIKISDNEEIKSKFYEVMKSIREDSRYASIAKLYKGRIGTDLDEEVFCKLMEDVLSNVIERNSQASLSIVNDGLIMYGLKSILDNDLEINDIINTSLEYIVEKYMSDAFEVSDTISKDYIKRSQKLATAKNNLFFSKDEDNKLWQECE